MRHVSSFLSPATRAAYGAGAVDLVRNPSKRCRIAADLDAVLDLHAAASPPDAHGCCARGTNRRYVA